MELKNNLGQCPNCGEELDMYVRCDNGYFAVQCLNCMYVGPASKSIDKAVDDWNKEGMPDGESVCQLPAATAFRRLERDRPGNHGLDRAGIMHLQKELRQITGK